MNKLNPKLSLSKSLYTKGLQCKKSLWLKKYKPEVLTPADALTQSIFEQGNVVGNLACGLFPEGKEVPFNPDDYDGMEHIESSATMIRLYIPELLKVDKVIYLDMEWV